MKKILIAISIATIFAACQTQDKGSLEIKKETIPLDTTGTYRSNANADTAKNMQSVTTQQKTITTTTQQQAPPSQVIYKTRTIVHNNTRYIPAPTPKSSNTTSQANNPLPNSKPATAGNSGNIPNNGNGTGNGNVNGTSTGNYPNNGGIVPTKPVPDKNRGWSDAAKDATIGGVGGAIGGAVISKNKGKGALIGGILGAAGGYILGRKKDKANNRDSTIR